MTLTEELQKTDLFKEVDLVDLEALITRMHQETYPSGTVLFREGDMGDSMYIIQEGRIRIFMHDSHEQEITLTHYGQNEIFGELSPIDQRPRSASASAAEPLTVMILERSDFMNLLNERPQLGLAMMRSLAQRLRNTTTYLEEFKPSRFETAPVDQGTSLRREASPTIADLIDQKISGDAASDSSPEKPINGMGIFDRIANQDLAKDTSESET